MTALAPSPQTGALSAPAGDDLREWLREQTASRHQQTEALPIMGELASGLMVRERYVSYLQASYRLYRSVEVAISRVCPLPYELSRLRQHQRIAVDLATLAAPALERATDAAQEAIALAVRTAGQRAGTWGALYVLEGARLGSQLLIKRNQKNPVVISASRFLRGEGDDTAAGWHAFLALLPPAKTLDSIACAAAASAVFDALATLLDAVDRRR